MLFNNEWYMDKSEAQEKSLVVDAGAEAIMEECWIYGEDAERIDSNGNVCGVFWQETRGVFEELIVPDSVLRVDERAFYRHVGLRKISVLTNVTEIGKEAFKGCDGLSHVVAPLVPIGSIADPDSKMKLAMGFLLNRELYSAEVAKDYEAYIKKQKTKLLQAAQKYALSEAEAALGGLPSATMVPKEKVEKLNAEDAVLLLEKTVLTGTKDEIVSVIESYKPFELTARVLGFACRCRETEIVELLLGENATFSYESRKQITKYGLSHKPSGKEFVADFMLLMVVDNVWNKYLFGSMDKHYVRKDAKVVRSEFLKGEKDVSAVPDEMKMAPAEIRVANLKLLVKKGLLSKDNLNLLLYYTILEEQNELADVLSSMGAVIDVPWLLADAKHSDCISETNQYLDAMNEKTDERMLAVLSAFGAELEKIGKKMYLSDTIFNGLGGPIHASIARQLLKCGDDSGINKKPFMQRLVRIKGNSDVVAVVLEHGFVKTPKLRDELIELASKAKRTATVAVLMDYKNRTADPAAEARKAEAALSKELSASPDSVAEMKKKWIYKKKEDGTLIITAYKGDETEVVIPERIGKAVVTELDRQVFSVDAKRISNMAARKKIAKIVIPNTVQTIGSAAFWGCESLVEIEIPDSVTVMGTHMFTLCSALKNLKLSKNHRGEIADHFFSDCFSLETLTIPAGITGLGLCSMDGCKSLKEIHLSSGLERFWLCGLDRLKGVTIYAPKGSAAEKYAQEHQISFVEE